MLQVNINRRVDEELAKFVQSPAATTTATPSVTTDPLAPHRSEFNNNVSATQTSLQLSTNLFSSTKDSDRPIVAEHSVFSVDSTNCKPFGIALPAVPKINRIAPPVVWYDPPRDPMLTELPTNVTFPPDKAYTNPRDPRLSKLTMNATFPPTDLHEHPHDPRLLKSETSATNPAASDRRSQDSMGNSSFPSNNSSSLSEELTPKDPRIARPKSSRSPFVKEIPLTMRGSVVDPRLDVDLLENAKLVNSTFFKLISAKFWCDFHLLDGFFFSCNPKNYHI